jgi:hypothetical protein
MPTWRMKGEYLKNCSCVPGCPCDTHGYPGPNEFCEGAIGMNIVEGNFEETDLSGLRWIATVHWPKALHEGNGTAELFIDEKADERQREALGTILSGQAGGADLRDPVRDHHDRARTALRSDRVGVR